MVAAKDSPTVSHGAPATPNTQGTYGPEFLASMRVPGTRGAAGLESSRSGFWVFQGMPVGLQVK